MHLQSASLPLKLLRLFVCVALSVGAAGAQPSSYTMETVAGSWTPPIGEGYSPALSGGYSGDGGAATSAELNNPEGVAMDGDGNLYIADTGNERIRKVNATGIISTVAGTGPDIGCSYFEDGLATATPLCTPSDVAVDGAGNLYIAESISSRIRKVDTEGIMTTVAGNGRAISAHRLPSDIGDGGPAVMAWLYHPKGVAVDDTGNLYIADTLNNRVRKVNTAGIITTVAGDGTYGYGGDGGVAASAKLHYPNDVAVDDTGNLYIADTRNNRVRKVNTKGIITTVAGGNSRPSRGNGDGGLATEAELYDPYDVAVDGAGNLYIVAGHRIRKVDTSGIITTIAGWGGTYNGEGYGSVATRTTLNNPSGVAVDVTGNLLYVADTYNQRVRRLTPNGFLISPGGVVLATGTPVVNRISPNALISVFGQGFAPEGTLEFNADGTVADILADTCLQIENIGNRGFAPLFLVTPTQINAQVPWRSDRPDNYYGPSISTNQVTVLHNCSAYRTTRPLAYYDVQYSESATVEIAAVSPAFFNFPVNSDGRNPLMAMHGGGPALAGPPGLIPGVALTPAEPGEVVTFFGTGFGHTKPRLQAGEIPGGPIPLAGDILFTVGGIAVPPGDVLYAGAAPCCAGLQQFAVRLPPILEDGHAPVTAAVQGVSTPEGPFLAIGRR